MASGTAVRRIEDDRPSPTDVAALGHRGRCPVDPLAHQGVHIMTRTSVEPIHVPANRATELIISDYLPLWMLHHERWFPPHVSAGLHVGEGRYALVDNAQLFVVPDYWQVGDLAEPTPPVGEIWIELHDGTPAVRWQLYPRAKEAITDDDISDLIAE